MTTKHQWADQARLNESRLEALLQLGHMTEASLREITDFALEQAVALTGSQIGYLAFASDDETMLTMHSWSRTAMRECEIREKPLEYHVAATGLWGEAIRQRQPMVTNDYTAANPCKKGLPEGHVALTRHMNVPVLDDGKIVIVAGVGNKATDYDESDIRQLTLLMEGMWRLIQRKRVQDELRRHRDHLEQLVAERTAELVQSNQQVLCVNEKLAEANEQLTHEIEEHRQDHEAFWAEHLRLIRLLELHQNERRLVAYELHDGLVQQVTAALMELECLYRLPDEAAAATVERARLLLRAAMTEARTLISGLRPPGLEERGVEAAVEDVILQRGAAPPPTVEFVSSLGGRRMAPLLEDIVFRIIQEAVTNARRHSQGQHVRVNLGCCRERVTIEVVDDGVGFDLDAVAKDRFGLEGIRQRARIVGGHVIIQSGPGQGTQVCVDLPLLAPDAELAASGDSMIGSPSSA